MSSLDFDAMTEANGRRCERWHGRSWLRADDSWTLADWSNAMTGEAGEAANVVKKLRRIESGLWETKAYPGESSHSIGLVDLPADEAYRVLVQKLEDELADVVLYADLLAQKAGIDLGEAVRDKFNRVSAAQGFPEKL